MGSWLNKSGLLLHEENLPRCYILYKPTVTRTWQLDSVRRCALCSSMSDSWCVSALCVGGLPFPVPTLWETFSSTGEHRVSRTKDYITAGLLNSVLCVCAHLKRSKCFFSITSYSSSLDAACSHIFHWLIRLFVMLVLLACYSFPQIGTLHILRLLFWEFKLTLVRKKQLRQS